MDLEPWDPLDHPARIEVRRQESDDSDAEGGLGNVTRVVLRPPGHSGKAKRGHLCFDSSYESGNLGRVDFISEFEYDLFIRPDTCNPRYRLWFNFVVDNVRADQRVIFNVVNLSKVKTLYRDGMTPLVRSSSRPVWQRMSAKYVYYHKSPEHRNHYILSFAFAFDREEDVYQFAFSFPFSYSRCQAHLDLVDQKQLPFFKRETISLSLQNRKVEVVTLATPAVTLGPGVKRPKTIVLMARCHPGESPTSFVVQGLIDFFLGNHPMVAALRDHVVVKVIPMANPDGVFLGNYRCSLMGYDLNRHWNQVSPWAHPTLHAVKNFLAELDSSKTLDLDMVIDLHAHSSLTGAFIYGNAYDDVYRFERHILFPKLLAHNAEDYTVSHTMYNRDAHKAGTGRRHLCEMLKSTVNVYTLEVSFYGYHQQGTNNFVTYNEDCYFRLGRNLARTLFEYYRAVGVIPANILGTPTGSNINQDGEKKIQRKSRSRSRSRSRSKPSAKAKAVNLDQKSSTKEQSPSVSTTQKSQDAVAPTKSRNKPAASKLGKPSDQEKTVLELAQLTREKSTRECSSDSSDEAFNENVPQPNRAMYEENQRRRQEQKDQASMEPNAQTSFPPLLSERADSRDTNPPASPAAKRRVRIQRKSATERNKIREQTASFKTFDFSAIRTLDHFIIGNRHVLRGKDLMGRSKRSGLSTGRKIGGGGIVGKASTVVGKKVGKRTITDGWHSEPETDAPCLTIIDFNMLIRKGLEEKLSGTSGGAWKGLKTNSKRYPGGIVASNRLADIVGLKSFRLSAPGSKGTGESRSRRRKYSHSHYVRRRQAVLLRGTVTDCSPWEDSAGETSSSDSSVNSRQIAPTSMTSNPTPTTSNPDTNPLHSDHHRRQLINSQQQRIESAKVQPRTTTKVSPILMTI